MPVSHNKLLAMRWAFRQTGRKLTPRPKCERVHRTVTTFSETPYQEGLRKQLQAAEDACEFNLQDYRHYALIVPVAMFYSANTSLEDFWVSCRHCHKRLLTKKDRKQHRQNTDCVDFIEAHYKERKGLKRCVNCGSTTSDSFLGFPCCAHCVTHFKTTSRFAPTYSHWRA